MDFHLQSLKNNIRKIKTPDEDIKFHTSIYFLFLKKLHQNDNKWAVY